MHRLIQSLVALAVVAFSTFAVAAPIVVPHTFTAGTPAKAAEINANFQAVVTAINTLSARVDKLDGTTPPTMAELAGTYSFNSFNTRLLKSDGGQAVITSTGSGTFTLAADGTGTVTSAEAGYSLSLTAPSTIAPSTAPYNFSFNGAFTWSLSGGKVLFAGGGELFSIVAGGQLLIAALPDNGLKGSNLYLLTRIK